MIFGFFVERTLSFLLLYMFRWLKPPPYISFLKKRNVCKEKTGFGVFASYFSALLLIIIFSICIANSPSAQTELFNPTQGEKSRVLRYSA